MLGPRVPAIVISPLVPRGTLDQRVHEHAGVPATLRALFSPGAPPLTGRDRWAVSFADLASLPEPRTDLPDLSGYRSPPAREGLVAAPAAGSGPPEERVPGYYWEFVGQVDQVRDRLVAVGEPEIAAAADVAGAQRGAAITTAFAAAAHRHRHGPAGAVPG